MFASRIPEPQGGVANSRESELLGYLRVSKLGIEPAIPQEIEALISLA
jgi:hypothetical protein